MLGRWTTVLHPWPAGSTENQLECPQKMACSEQSSAAKKKKKKKARERERGKTVQLKSERQSPSPITIS